MPVDATKFADRLANLTLIGQRAARDGSAAFQKAIEVTADLESGNTLRPIHEDGESA